MTEKQQGVKFDSFSLWHGKELVTKDGSNAWAVDILTDSIVGLYFSASWCPPCKQFTPVLKDLHEELKHRGAPFEVLFISLDQTEEEMMNYMEQSHGDWFATKHESEFSKQLISLHNIKAIPKLIITKPNGDVITDKGRKEVQDRGVMCFRTWASIAGVAEVMQRDNKDEEEDDT